jgi:hypothetical protein
MISVSKDRTRAELLGGSLPEFQARLTASTRVNGESDAAFVALKVDKQNWLIDLVHLQETSVPPVIARGGRAPVGIVGIGNFHGEVLTLVDLQSLLLGRPLPDPKLGWATPLHPRFDVALALLWTDLVGLVPKSDFTLISEGFENTVSPSDMAHPEWVLNRWKDGAGKEWWEFNTLHFVQPDSMDGWMKVDTGEPKA